MVRRNLGFYNVTTFVVLFYQVHSIISECVDGDYYSSERDCGAFYQCSNGQLFEHRCPGELYFNPVLNVCDYPENVQCGGSIEPTTSRQSSIPTTTVTPNTTYSASTTQEATTQTNSPGIFNVDLWLLKNRNFLFILRLRSSQLICTNLSNFKLIIEPSIKHALACEHSTLAIECIPGQEIHVRDANYGRVSPTVCNEDGSKSTLDLNCLSGNSYDIVSAQCDGTESCSVPAENAVFGDPCVNTYKYLSVDYKCTPE